MLIGVVLLFFLLAAAAVLSYHRTVPPLTRAVRYPLLVIRLAAYLLLILLFFDPRCAREGRITDAAQVAIVIDNSESMGLPVLAAPNGGPTRFQRALTLADRVDSLVSARGGIARRFFFASDLLPASAAPERAGGLGTNISAALKTLHEKLEGEHCTAVLLLSDGMETVSPLLDEELPPLAVYAAGLGDTVPAEDIRIKEVDYNPLVRSPSRQVIRALLANDGPRPKRIAVTLLESGAPLVKRELEIEPQSERQVELPIEANEPGRRSLQVVVDVDGFDAQAANNRRELIITAEKADIALLIVDQMPTWEHQFFTGLLKREETISFDLIGPVSQDGQRRFVDPASFSAVLGNYDLLVISTLSPGLIGEAEAKAIERFVTGAGKGVLVLPGPASLFEEPVAWRLLQPLLPVTGTPPCRFVFTYTEVVPGEQAALHAVTADLLPVLSRTEWQERNPLLGYHASLTGKRGSQELLVTRKQRAPAVVYSGNGSGRVALISAGPLWRWKFLPEEGGIYDQFMSRLIDLLARGEDASRFSLVAKKSIFEAGEPIELYAELFDTKMQPVTGVPVRLEIASVDAVGRDVPLRGVAMIPSGPQSTRYTATLSPLPQGTYHLRAEAELQERLFESPVLEIAVSSVSVEFQSVTQDARRLRVLASRTGGRYMNAAGIDPLVEAIPLQSRERVTVSEISLRTSALLFAAVLLLLSVEWIVRKRAGLV